MDKIKLLTFAIIALLLLNLATLSFLIFSGSKNNDRPENRPQPREIIIDKLHLDEQQQEQYEKLIHWHRSQINKLEEENQQTKQQLYLQLQKPEVNNILKDSLINNLSRIQKQIENTHFKHFQDIKKICTPNQMKRYNELTEELSRLFSKPHPPRPEHD